MSKYGRSRCAACGQFEKVDDMLYMQVYGFAHRPFVLKHRSSILAELFHPECIDREMDQVKSILQARLA